MNTTSLTRYFASSGEATIEADRITDHCWNAIRSKVHQTIVQFLMLGPKASALRSLETLLRECVMELGRLLLQETLNSFEPDDPTLMPHDLLLSGSGYRRLKDKTRNQNVATIFGNICLCGQEKVSGTFLLTQAQYTPL
jgi:hypothetical protein